ncbi:MAG: MAPEG family protein [Hyphomonadaceae bacterium]|nr:MAPEG family protein [Hyphomonadaceae bacterium]
MDDAFVALALYTGLSALMLLVLTLNVSLNRGKHRTVQPGQMGEGAVVRAIRAHANFTEYAPLVLLMLGVLALNRTAALPIHILGAAFLVGRVLHALGMLQPKHPNAARVLGAFITVLVLLAGGILCLMRFYEAL